MRRFPLFLLISTFAFLASVHGEKRPNGVKEALVVSTAKSTAMVHPEDTELDKNVTKLEDKVNGKCQHTDYRSYVECLLEESKREKRQGYNQQCLGSGCAPVIQPQFCPGNGCLRTNQQPCSGSGCVLFDYNCVATTCTQVGRNCYGMGCVPACNNGSPCEARSEPTIRAVDDDAFRREIKEIREDLGLMKIQNENLIKTTERATSFILQLVNRPNLEPRIVREPVLVGHNSTTNIDISNYLNNTNVVNVPEVKNDAVIKENKTRCCTVVRPKTCRRISSTPYFGCSHRRHRTCGSHCSESHVVYSRSREGCTGGIDENCVSYYPQPYDPTFAAYPTSGYYPAAPPYYPMYAPPQMPIYPPPQTPIYAPPPIYLTDDTEEDEDCEDCEFQVEAEDCKESDVKCKRVAKRDRAERTGLRPNTDVQSLGEIRRVKKEARAIKRSEDQLTASLDMLREAVELKKLEEEKQEEETSVRNIENISEDAQSPVSVPGPSFFIRH